MTIGVVGIVLVVALNVLANWLAWRRLGFKMVKWILSIELVEDIRSVGSGQGGFAEDHEYFGELANI